MALNQDIAILRQVPLFAVLDAEALRLVAFSAESRVYRAGDVLFQRGEASDGGYVVLSGSVALDSRDDGSPDGYVAGPGVLIGELALVVETERPATAVVREAASVMKVTRRVFRRARSKASRSPSSTSTPRCRSRFPSVRRSCPNTPTCAICW